MELTAEQRERMARADGSIHLWFGLSYCNYAVQPRSVLQSMPADWQQRFVALMSEAEEMGYEWPGEGSTYSVLLRDDETGRFVPDKQRFYRHVFIEPKPE